MKNVFRLIGITVIAAVIGFAFIACDDGNGGGGGGGPAKTLVVTMPSSILSQSSNIFIMGVFPVGTTAQQAIDLTGLIAGYDMNRAGIPSYSTSGYNYIVTIPLYTPTDARWTGSGTFDLYAMLGSNSSVFYYKAGSVNISSETTNITINSNNQVQYP